MLTIDIASLKEGLHDVQLAPEAAALGLDPALFRDIRVDVQLDHHRGRILARIEVRATATLECDRTLVLFDTPVSGRHSLLFAPPEFAQAASGQTDEVRVLLPADREIDLTEAVRDTLLLALPQRRIAPEAEDLEIETRFGDVPQEGEPVDPRWEALRKLRPGNTDV